VALDAGRSEASGRRPDVQPLRAQPFPLAAARDLLGLVRALWLAARAEGPAAADRCRALESIGLDLQLAIANARNMPYPNTPQQGTAWMLADRAIKALGELMAGDERALGPVIEAAVRRVGSR
jgi:hypothetical protein